MRCSAGFFNSAQGALRANTMSRAHTQISKALLLLKYIVHWPIDAWSKFFDLLKCSHKENIFSSIDKPAHTRMSWSAVLKQVCRGRRKQQRPSRVPWWGGRSWNRWCYSAKGQRQGRVQSTQASHTPMFIPGHVPVSALTQTHHCSWLDRLLSTKSMGGGWAGLFSHSKGALCRCS